MAGRDNKPAPEPELTISRPQAVRLLHVSSRTFDRLEASGVLTPLARRRGTKGATYDAAALVAAYLAHQERRLTGSLESPRDRRDRSQAELNELKLARERGELLAVEDVVSEGRTYIAAVQARLRAIGPRLAQEGMADAGARAAVLVEEAIEEMARWRTRLDALAAVKTHA